MDRLGKYEIRSVLGRGSMGTVYLGWDPLISRRVAIKTVRLPDGEDSEAREQLARFQQEAQAAGRLQHPNIVGVFDYAEVEELAYIVMEFVDGRTLKSMLDDGATPSVDVAGRLMDGLLKGLGYSHSQGVIHRDIKPANVIVTPAGDVKIADFGIARIESSTMTQAGTIMGTPAYMSPEQFQGSTVDARTDIYSAGVVLFQLLTGKRPFEGSMATIMHAVMTARPPRPSEMSASISPALDAVVLQAMARAPEDRFPTAAAFADALRAALAAPVLPAGLGDLGDDDGTVVRPAVPQAVPAQATKVPPAKPSASPAKPKSRLPLVLAGVAVVLVAGGAAFWTFSGSPSPPQVATGPAPAAAPDETAAASPPAPPPAPAASSPAAGPPLPEPTPAAQPAPMPPSSTPVAPPASASAAAQPVPSAPAPATMLAAATPHPAQPAVSAPIAPPPATLPVTPPPAVLASATPAPDVVRHAIAAALRTAPCSMVTGDDRAPGASVLRGVVGRGGPEAALHTALQQAAPNTAFDWQVTATYAPACPMLDLLRPLVRPYADDGRSLGLALTSGRSELVAGDLVIIRMTTPDYPAHLQLDYVSSDGSIAHLHDALGGTPYPADAPTVFGEPRPPGFKGWAVDVPFGTDMIVGIASSVPLFRAPRPADDTLATYLRDLRAAIDQAVRGGARVSAAVLPVRTRARP